MDAAPLACCPVASGPTGDRKGPVFRPDPPVVNRSLKGYSAYGLMVSTYVPDTSATVPDGLAPKA